MALNGVKTTDLSSTPLVDHLLGNYQGSTLIIPVQSFYDQITQNVVFPGQFFDTVASMAADTNLIIGQTVRTLGYTAKGDGGANTYRIVAAGTGVDDGKTFIDLPGTSLQAQGLFVDGTVRDAQGGITSKNIDFGGSVRIKAQAIDNLPFLSVSDLAVGQLPQNHIFVRHDTSVRNDATTFQLQRIVDTANGYTNPKNFRAVTTISVDTTDAEWAISGEVENNSNLSGLGVTAVSGVADKKGLAGVFGGHFQAKDWNIFALDMDVTALIGMEINTPAVGADHPTANNGTGLRRGLTVIARTNEQVANWNTTGGNDGDAEIGVGILIRTDNLTDGTYRYGIVIDDISQVGNPNNIATGALIRTSGADGIAVRGQNTASGIRISPTALAANGLVVEGTYSNAAIKIPGGQKIKFGAVGVDAIFLHHNVAANAVEIRKGATVLASWPT